MGFHTLAEWLAWQESLHPKTIDLGLGRVCEVLNRLDLRDATRITLSVAGTNGKGSSVAMLDAILRAAGYRVGTYTSPHILSYNERIAIDGSPVSDAMIMAAFERIEAARDDISLSFFEFGTLAALVIFDDADLDARILEVGLGGRLDAVNAVDADIAMIASIDIDHQEWLGTTREAIGLEKAGILRPGRPAIIGDPDLPASVLRFAQQQGIPLFRQGLEFDYERQPLEWTFRGSRRQIADLPTPALLGDHQFLNAAAVLECLSHFPSDFEIPDEAIAEGLRKVQLKGRFQFFPGDVPVLLDVAHNAQSVRILKGYLDACYPDRRIRAVFSVMRDKDVESIVQLIKGRIDTWYLAPLAMPRAATSEELSEILHNGGVENVRSGFQDAQAAWSLAREESMPGDMILVFGSFFLVSDYLAHIA